VSLSKKVALAGVDESDQIGICEGKTALILHAEAARNALSDAGLEKSDVDGLFTAGPSVMQLAEYLGIRPSYIDGTSVGGSSFVIQVEHAAVNAVGPHDEFGIKVHQHAREHDIVYKVAS